MSDEAKEKVRALLYLKIEQLEAADEVVRQASKFRQSHVGLARAIKRYQQLREKKA